MRGFSGKPITEVALTHGDETVTFRVHPRPLGYHDLITAAMPEPTPALNQKAAPPALLAQWSARVSFLMIAKALGDQLEAVAPPAGSPPAAWAAYADAVRAELEAANLVEGDLMAIMGAMAQVDRGVGTLPKP
jgi:hypothetical protein